MEGDSSDSFRALLPSYDLVLTYGGGDPVTRRYADLGARECHVVYNAVDPTTHHAVAPDPRFTADLGLLANRLPDREARIEEFFLRAATLLPDRTFLLGGNGWDDKPMPANVRRLGHVGTADHNAFNSTPLAVLNVTRDSMVANGWSPATRVFEVAGAGACQITDAWDGIEDFLTPDREVLVAHDGKEVAEHLAALEPLRAEELGEAAQKRVLAEHTYAHRAVQTDALLRERV
jgi:spore maturation protein CgeB